MTETSATAVSNTGEDYERKPASTGVPSATGEVKVVDDKGNELPRGEVGELWYKGPIVVRGYWQNEQATRETFVDGWIKTGDLAKIDDEGFVYIVDRAKDIVIRGGENIACQEVEAALYAHPDVAEAAVFGLPDDRFGEVPGAVVHLRGEPALDQATLQAFLADHIAAFKVPARIWFSTVALPRLGTEKIDKVSLRNTYRALAAAG